MRKTSTLSPAGQRRLEAAAKRFHEELEQQPALSDEAFMAEFGVPDEQYGCGLAFGVALPNTGVADEEDNA